MDAFSTLPELFEFSSTPALGSTPTTSAAWTKFAIIESPFSVEGGELTPTLKIRRGVVERKYKAAIDRLYEGNQ